MCLVTFTSELIAKRHSLSCHHKCDYSTNVISYEIYNAFVVVSGVASWARSGHGPTFGYDRSGRWLDVIRPIQPAYCHDGRPNDGHYVQ